MRHNTNQNQGYVSPEVSQYHADNLYRTIEQFFAYASIITSVKHLNFVYDHYLECAETLTEEANVRAAQEHNRTIQFFVELHVQWEKFKHFSPEYWAHEKRLLDQKGKDND